MGLKLILLPRENTSEDTEIQSHELTNPPCKKANWMFPEGTLLCPAQCSVFDKYRGWTQPSFLWQAARNPVGSQSNPIHYPGTMWPCSLCTRSRWKIENSQKCSASNSVRGGRGSQKAEFASTTVITCFQKLVMLNSIEAVQMPKNLLLQGWEK